MTLHFKFEHVVASRQVKAIQVKANDVASRTLSISKFDRFFFFQKTGAIAISLKMEILNEVISGEIIELSQRLFRSI